MAKARKLTRKGLVRNLDKELSLHIRQRDGRCVICGSTESLTNGHLFSRQSYSTRWDYSEDGNCHTQCLKCNLSHEYDPYPFTSWYIKKFGLDKYDELHRRHKTILKLKDFQLQELLNKIKLLTKTG